MSALAIIDREQQTRPRAKALPRKQWTAEEKLFGRGLPPGLVYRGGARELLLQRPAGRALVADYYQSIREHFGPNAQIALERFDDPDEEASTPILYLTIGTDLSALDARQALDRVEDSFGLDNVEPGQDGVYLSLEFL